MTNGPLIVQSDKTLLLEIDHPNYLESVELAPSTVAELLTDLRPS